MPFCPECNTEFGDGIAECIDCGVVLREGGAPDDIEAVEPVEEDRFVALRSYPSRIHAEMVAEILANAGIQGMIRSNEMFGPGTGLGSMAPPLIEIWVPAEKLHDAETIADSTMDSI